MTNPASPHDPASETAAAVLVEQAAIALCNADKTWEHHDQTDDHPCARCRYYAQTLAAANLLAANLPADGGATLDVEAERCLADHPTHKPHVWSFGSPDWFWCDGWPTAVPPATLDAGERAAEWDVGVVGGIGAAFPMYGFEGCTDRNPDVCACATAEDVDCAVCGEVIEPGTPTYARQEGQPWMDPDDADQEWITLWWHASCDTRSDLAATPTTEATEHPFQRPLIGMFCTHSIVVRRECGKPLDDPCHAEPSPTTEAARLMTVPHDGHECGVTCPDCPHAPAPTTEAAEQDGGCVPCRACGGDQRRGWHLRDRPASTTGDEGTTVTEPASVWDEAVKAVAWALENGPSVSWQLDNGPSDAALSYVRGHNPYRDSEATAEASTGADGGGDS